MGDTFTEVTHTSWFSRIGASIKGFFIGVLLIIVGVCLLFWNEGRAVKTHRALVESQGLVVAINAQETAPQMNDKLVHLTGEATTEETLSDNLLPMHAQALKLRRQVQTYQWEEKSHSEEDTNIGGDTETVTTYEYEKVWSAAQIDSTRFKRPSGHENLTKWRYYPTTWVADQIRIGNYQLSTTFKDEIVNFQDLPFPDNIALPKGMEIHGAELYYGKNTKHPTIGDQRIYFEVIPAQTYSAVGHLQGTELLEHFASNGESIALLTAGTHTADAMFEKAKSDNVTITWVLRVVGYVVLIAAFTMILKPLSVLADVVPFIGNIVDLGTGLVSVFLGSTLALATISVAWIFYRPLIGLVLLAVSAGLIYWLKQKSNRVTQAAQLNQTSAATT